MLLAEVIYYEANDWSVLMIVALEETLGNQVIIGGTQISV